MNYLPKTLLALLFASAFAGFSSDFITGFIPSFSSVAQAAPCGSHSFTPPEAVRPKGDSVLLVTHPSTLWDGRFSSKVGMDSAVAFAKKHQIPVIFLQGNDSQETYFFSDCNPDFWVSSNGGELSFPVEANHVYSVGGHWELCQANTMRDLMSAWSKKTKVDLTLTQVLDGLYAYGQFVTANDAYYSDFTKFMNIISYRKPGEDWPKRKLNMLEMMGVIHDEAQEAEYLKRNLPDYTQIAPEYEVQLVINTKLVEVLRKGRGEHPPVLKLEYVDSLYQGGYAPSAPLSDLHFAHKL